MTKQEYNRLDRIVRGLEEFKDRPESVNLRIVELRAMLDETWRQLSIQDMHRLPGDEPLRSANEPPR